MTLSLDKNVIVRAKRYAKKRNTSLSRLVEAYLIKTSSPEAEEPAISPLVKSLSGVIKLEEGADHKKAYGDYLVRKYSRR